MFNRMLKRIVVLNREIESLEAKILEKKITNPAHIYKKEILKKHAQVEVLMELMIEHTELRKGRLNEVLG